MAVHSFSSGIMEVNWQNIDSALQKLTVHGAGFWFQHLAISLAKQRWPEMIAPETFSDGGEDAFIPICFKSNGKHLSVGCSFTGTYTKIRDDVNTIKNRGKSLDVFVFYTPKKINNREWADKWAPKLKKEFGCDLILITREDIIQCGRNLGNKEA